MHACPPHSDVMTVAPHLSLVHPRMPRLAKFGLRLALGFVRLAKSNLHNTDDQGCRTAFGPRFIARSTVRHVAHRSSHTVMDADKPRPLHQDPKQPPARLPSPPRAQVSGLELTNTGRHRGGGKASNLLFKRPKAGNARLDLSKQNTTHASPKLLRNDGCCAAALMSHATA